MPWSTFGEPGHRQPTPPDQSVFGQGIDRVLAARRHEPARRRAQRGHHVPVQLDQENQCVHGDFACPTSGPARARPQAHRSAPARRAERRNPRRSCCSNRADETCRLLGNARMTSRSDGSRSSSTARATWRSRRATRCRSTAEPTDLATINPTCGPAPSCSGTRRMCTTTSGCAMRVPYFTVAPNSDDRLMRLRAGSTARKPIAEDQAERARRPLRRRLATIPRPARVRIRNRKPCTRARRRLFGWKVRLPLATAFSSLYLGPRDPGRPPVKRRHDHGRRWALLLAGAVPIRLGSQPYRRLPGDCLRVLTSHPRVKPGLRQPWRVNRSLPVAEAFRRRRPYSANGPTEPKPGNWNTAERLAAAQKTVSFLQCRARLGRRPTTKRGWRIDWLPRRPPGCHQHEHCELSPVGCGPHYDHPVHNCA